VNDIADHLIGPRRPEGLRLSHGIGYRNETLAVQALGRGTVVEGDDIGGTLVLEKSPVHSGHFSRGNKMKSQLRFQTHGLEKIEGQLAKAAHLERAIFLAIA